MDNEISSNLFNIGVDNNHVIKFSVIYKLFGSDINKIKEILDFCRENNIILDISLEDANLLQRDSRNINVNNHDINDDQKIKSLDSIILVRRDFNVPMNGKVESVSKKVTKMVDTSATINGAKTNFQVDSSVGYNTISWMMNQEVVPHKDAPDGWYDRTITILQPLTESIYKEAAGLYPSDTYFTKPVTLDKAIIICKNPEDAQLARKENPNATVILFGSMHEYTVGIGNLIAVLLGYKVFYKMFDGYFLDGKVNTSVDLYSEELQKSHPKLVDSSGPVGSTEHDFSYAIQIFTARAEKTKYVLNNTSDEYISNSTLDKLISSFDIGFLPFYPMSIDSKFYKCLDYLPDKYSEDRDFFRELSKSEFFDANNIFSLICKGITIDSNNEEAMTRIKEMVIKEVEDYNKIYNLEYDKVYSQRKDLASLEEIRKDVFDRIEVSKKYVSCINKFYLFKMICNSSFIKAKVDKSVKYDLPIKYYDFSHILDEGNMPDQDLASIVSSMLLTEENEEKNLSSIKISPYPSNNEVSKLIESIDLCSIDSQEIDMIAQGIMDKYVCNDEQLHYLLKNFIINYKTDSNFYNMSLILLTTQKISQTRLKQENIKQ